MKVPERGPVVLEGWIAVEGDEDTCWGVIFFDDASLYTDNMDFEWDFKDGVRWHYGFVGDGIGFSPCPTLHAALLGNMDLYAGMLERQRVRITIEAIEE